MGHENRSIEGTKYTSSINQEESSGSDIVRNVSLNKNK